MRMKKVAALLMATCLAVSVSAPVFAGGGGLPGEPQKWADTNKTTEIMYMEYKDTPKATVWDKGNLKGYTWEINTYGGFLSVNEEEGYRYVSSYIPTKSDFTVLGPNGNPLDFDVEIKEIRAQQGTPDLLGYQVLCTVNSTATGIYTVTMARSGYQFLYRESRDNYGSYQEEGMTFEVYPRPVITVGEEDSQGNVKVTIEIPDDYKKDEITKVWCTVTSERKEWVTPDGEKVGYYDSKEIASSTTLPIECILSKVDCCYDNTGYTDIRASVRYENSKYTNWSKTVRYRFPSDGPAPEIPDDLDDPDEPDTPNKPTTPDNPGNSSSGNSGSSYSGSSSSASGQTEQPKTYTATQARADLKKAAEKDGKVQLKNIAEIPFTALKVLQGEDVVLQADQTEKGKIVFRMTLDPTKADAKVKTIQTGAKLEDKKTQEKFEKYFSNKMRFIRLNQKGSYGMEIKAAAKLDLKGMNTGNLYFYSYDAATNRYSRIKNPQYYVDRNGYLHFATAEGGTIIISEKPLVRR